jgi:hypothetical protein
MQVTANSWSPYKKPLYECCFELTIDWQDTSAVLFSLISGIPNLPVILPSGRVVIWHFTAFVKMPVDQDSIGPIPNPRIEVDIVFGDDLIEDRVCDIETAEIQIECFTLSIPELER